MAPNNNDYKYYATASAADTLIEEEKKVDGSSSVTTTNDMEISSTNQNAKDSSADNHRNVNSDSKLPAFGTTASFTKHEPESTSSSSEGYIFSSSSALPHEHGSTSHYMNGHRRKLPSKGGGEPDTEAGLELLFAASLIQQKDESNKQKLEQQQKELVAQQPPPPGAKAISSCSENESAAGDSPLHTSAELATESSTTRTTDQVVEEPSDRDVLCGRGGFINKHVGNIVYRKVVDHNKAIYKQVPKRHRILVSQSIVQTILKHGGRFLQPVSGQGRKNQTWTCIQFRRAVQKTSQALREPSIEATDTPAAAAGESVESETSNSAL